MAAITFNNVCPGNAGGHEPIQRESKDIRLEFKYITDETSLAGSIVSSFCKHCGCPYAVSVEDSD